MSDYQAMEPYFVQTQSVGRFALASAIGVVAFCAGYALASGSMSMPTAHYAPSVTAPTLVQSHVVTPTALRATHSQDMADAPQELSRRQQLMGSAWSLAAGFWANRATAAGACPGSPVQCAYEGQYSDPFHPDGYRTVVVNGDGTATISGIDRADGPVWTLTGNFEGSSLLIDFRPKGGPANLLSNYKDGGIRFPDGNTWTKQ
uniref:Uncharacterized protein n=1 Tax=Eutreptiella gymnastica TaxID=73025 RepID=A0A7S1I5G1_9EUGL|mmetsp:Transcript_131389/g.227489  ORF Transcript_131389/g.227489 Transcript_131389/m.227489 type:complete len:203 (+) Transcript_131389:22-630(+)